jgi:Phage terminase large subunit gpA, ATPase domain
MTMLGNGSPSLSSRGYLRSRLPEITSPATRATSEPLALWSERRVRLDGKPFSFEGHEYLRAIYDDTSPHVVLSKASQVGGTTWAILRSLHACLAGLNVIYFFPTRTDVLEFSKSRVTPLMADNPFLQRELKDTDAAGLKRIGDAHLYLRGMQSNIGMKSVPADMVVFDELDEASPDAKAVAKERLAHSSYRRLIELSNPSIPGYGIDEAYLESDQRHWTLKCPGCGKWTALDKAFPMKLGEEVRIIRQREDGNFYRACPACDAELDLSLGEWVADYPSRTIHGYRISQLFSSKVDPGEILHDYQKTYHPERFYTLKIGVPWVDIENKLSTHEVLALCGDHGILEASDRGCTMGIDTGKELHVVISRRRDPKGERIEREVVYIGAVQSYEELDSLMERFKVTRCVIDALPDIHATRQFAGRHRGIVFMNYFNEAQKGSVKWDREQHIVQVNRTEALDSAKKGVRDKQVILPRRVPLLETFAEHLASDAKKLIEDNETGAKSYRYVRTGTNHYSLAFTYDWLACEQERRPYVAWFSSEIHEDDRPIAWKMLKMMEHETGIRWGDPWPDRF